MSDVAQRAVVR